MWFAAFCCLLFPTWFAHHGPISSAAKPETGAVVEEVVRNSASDNAGIVEGDTLLQWRRSDSSGAIQSPFDLTILEIEQAPLGTVILEGLHGTGKKTWTLTQDSWGIYARPDLPEDLLPLYREGRQLAQAGKWDEAEERWHTLADKEQRFAPWLSYRLATWEARARQWKRSDAAFATALTCAAKTETKVQAALFRSWARTFEQRSIWADAEKYYWQAYRHSDADGLSRALDLENLGRVTDERGDLSKAQEYFKQSLEIRKKLAPGGLAMAASLNGLAKIADDQNELAGAEDYARQALAIAEKLTPGGLMVASSLRNLGFVAQDRGELEKAEEFHSRSLEIRQRLLPGSLEVAASLTSIGSAHYLRDDLVKAEEYYTNALAIRQELAPDSLDAAASLSGLGLVEYRRGDVAKAKQYIQQALEVRQKLAPNSLDVAASLTYLGAIARDQGDLVKAEAYQREASVIWQHSAPNGLGVAAALDNLALAVADRGDLAKAEAYENQALTIGLRLAPGSLSLAETYENLGTIADAQNDLAKSERYFGLAFEIRKKLAPFSLQAADSLMELGSLYLKQGNFPRAEESCREALRIAEKIAPSGIDVATSLNCLGVGELKQGDLATAEESYRRAVEVLEKLAPASTLQAESLGGLAQVLQKQGQWEAADQYYEQALNALEGQAARLGGREDIKAGFRARHESYYRNYIGLLVSQNKAELALAVLERSRARTLLETLATAHVDIHKGASADQITKERSLAADIRAKSARRIYLLSEKRGNDEIQALEREISALTIEYEDLEGQIRSQSPVYAALSHPQLLSAQEIQQDLLDPDTVLLEYSLGEERSFAFLVSAQSLKTFVLPKRAVIEEAAQNLYGLLIARNRPPRNETFVARTTRIAQADTAFSRVAARLSEMILQPMAGQLSAKRMLVVSDGALYYVPFAALPLTKPGQGSAPLVAEHEIVNLPSASVLAVLRRERLQHKAAAKAVAVLADPVFETQDTRVIATSARDQQRHGGSRRPEMMEAHSEAEQSVAFAHLTRSAADLGWNTTRNGELYLPRLRFTRQEAEEIAAVAPAGQRLSALDFKASRATATSRELANYRIIHFATHALLDNKHPELSGLVLSLVDEHGRYQNGFLDLQDIYNLDLPAELVVLSACETALGKSVAGEGLIGLTRGFMYAGASRVMASLWNVDDQATAEFMGRFYRSMLAKGMRPAAALRAAQLQMRKETRWSSPYFWASFQMQGEWK